jgi:hypothetical protein
MVPHLLLKFRLQGKPWSFILEGAASFVLASAS